jgi:hypothetical protein
MFVRTTIKPLLKHIDEISTREFKLVAVACIIVVALNALVVAYVLGCEQGKVECGYPRYFTGGHRDFFHEFMRVKIEVALLIVAGGLWFRRVLAFFCSLLATLFVEYQYGLWYLDTRRWLREMGVADFSRLPVPEEWPNFAGLYRATFWDLAVFVFTTALLLWQISVIIRLLISPYRKRQS